MVNRWGQPAFAVPPNFRCAVEQNLSLSADNAVFRDNSKFLAGSLSTKESVKFWEQEILNEEQVNEKKKILTWLREGVRIEEFLKHFSKGRFHGQKYESKYPNSRKFANFVRPEHTEWVDREIHKLLSYGAIKTWKECGLEGDPVIVAPLQVEVETTKNRLIYNAQFLNCFMDPPPFKMDGVGKMAEIGWKGMFMFSIDHKNGYFHCRIHSSSWKFFAFEWKDQVYVFVVLCFGWSPAPYIYATLTEKVAVYIRKLTLAPFITWIDDNCAANSVQTKYASPWEQRRSANLVCFVTCMVLFNAGYFVNIAKSVLSPTTLIRHLGIMIDSEEGRFCIPQDRVDNLRAIIQKMVADGCCSLKVLEKCVGKCRSMSIAVPCAILYTRAQYATLAENLDNSLNPRLAREREVKICPESELYKELTLWLQLHTALINGSVWILPTRIHLRLLAFTDASSRRWAGVFKSPEGVCHMGGDFSEKELSLHINVKEAIALENSLNLFYEHNKEQVMGTTMVVKVDNQVLHNIYQNGGSTRQEYITQLCKKLFWLQLKGQFKLQLEWVPSKQNEADGITRVKVDDDIRLNRGAFGEILQKWGGVFRDLMASSGNVQRGLGGEELPFFSRYSDLRSMGEDVFTQDISRRRDAKYPDYCFPPLQLIGEFLDFAEKSGAWCIVVVPEMGANWGHMTRNRTRRVLQLATRGQKGKFLKFRKNALRTFTSKYHMFAIELDFRE